MRLATSRNSRARMRRRGSGCLSSLNSKARSLLTLIDNALDELWLLCETFNLFTVSKISSSNFTAFNKRCLFLAKGFSPPFFD